MQITEAPLPGILILKPAIHEDPRGYFLESYHQQRLEEAGITCRFIQDNQSLSRRGVIRGLHYQLAPFSQSKLVRVLSGAVWDVVVDIRKDSPTFGRQFGIELSDSNHLQLFIPPGFAHGFAATSESALFFYKCDRFYQPGAERGIRFSDPDLGIDWPFPVADAVVSPKDSVLPLFRDAELNLVYRT